MQKITNTITVSVHNVKLCISVTATAVCQTLYTYNCLTTDIYLIQFNDLKNAWLF